MLKVFRCSDQGYLKNGGWSHDPEFPDSASGLKPIIGTLKAMVEDMSKDPVASYLRLRENRYVVRKLKFGAAKRWLYLVLTGLHGICPLLAKVRIEAAFPSRLPLHFSVYDVPGSGDVVEHRIKSRKNALETVKWAILVSGPEFVNESNTKELLDLIKIDQNPLIVLSRMAADSRPTLKTAFWYHPLNREIKVHQYPAKPVDPNANADTEIIFNSQLAAFNSRESPAEAF